MYSISSVGVVLIPLGSIFSIDDVDKRARRLPRGHPNDIGHENNNRRFHFPEFPSRFCFRTSHLPSHQHSVRSRYSNAIIDHPTKFNKFSDFVEKWTVRSSLPSSLRSAHRRPLKPLQRGGIDNSNLPTFSTREGVVSYTRSTTPQKAAPIGAF